MTTNPHERAILDHLDANPGATVFDACLAYGPTRTEETAVAVVARLLWHRHLPHLIAHTPRRRVQTLEDAVAAACHLLFHAEPRMEFLAEAAGRSIPNP